METKEGVGETPMKGSQKGEHGLVQLEHRLYFSEDKEGVMAQIREVLMRRPEVLLAYVHGSFLTQERFHDIDVAVLFEQAWAKAHPQALGPLGEVLGLAAELERQVTPRYSFDVQPLNGAPLPFQYHVIREGKCLFYRNPKDLWNYEAYTASRYLDYLPTYECFKKALCEVIDRW